METEVISSTLGLFQIYVVAVALGVLSALAFGMLCAIAFPRLKKQGVIFAALMFGMLTSMATKPEGVPTPTITWSKGLTNNGSSYNTNDWNVISFRWRKDFSIADTETVYFAAKEKNAAEDAEWLELGSSTAGVLGYDYRWDDTEATNFYYYVFCTPSDVHTNGTWVANILLPTTKDKTKFVTIEGRIIENGKQISPPKEIANE